MEIKTKPNDAPCFIQIIIKIMDHREKINWVVNQSQFSSVPLSCSCPFDVLL